MTLLKSMPCTYRCTRSTGMILYPFFAAYCQTTMPNPNNPDERERELNRLVAELKMIRILQVRVNHDTKQTDQKRGEVNDLSADLQRKIQTIHDRQQDVHDVTDKLNTQRGDELR